MEEDPPLLPAEKKMEEGEKEVKKKGRGRPSSASSRSNMQIAQVDELNKQKLALKTEETSLLLNHSLLGGEKGKSMGEDEGKMALALIYGLRLTGFPHDTAAIERASFLLGKSIKTLWSLFIHWKEKKEILVKSTENRGAGSPLHPHHHIQLESEHIACIHRIIYEMNENGDGCKTNDIIAALKEEFELSLRPRSLRFILHRLGYQYGKAKYIGCINKEERKKRMIVFVKQFANALSKEEAGSHIIAYQDESYINQFHSDDRTWFAPSSPSKNHQRSRAQKIFDIEGWQLLFTPPYNSECQPIEKIWAKVKKFVANQYTSDRSLEITRMQTLDGFYGSPPNDYVGITSNFCNSCINHVIKYCDWFCHESIAGIEKMMDLVNENFLPPANQEEEEGNDDQLQVSDNENDDSDEE